MTELADKLDEAHGVRSASSLSQGLRVKCSHKSALMALERVRTTVQLDRGVSAAKRPPGMRLEPHCGVFSDETS